MNSIRRTGFIAVLIMALGLAACAETGPKQGLGTVTGAVLGGVVGNQFGGGKGKVLTTAAGAVIGALIGGEIGRQLDERDAELMAAAQYEALESGPPGAAVRWRNPGRPHYGEIVPGPYYEVNRYRCREYTHVVYIEGRRELLRGTACRHPDGTWRPLDG